MCIEINNLTFKYERQIIFDGLTLQLKEKNCYVLAGLNGCGKSTLLKIIGGKCITPSDTVSVMGNDPFRKTICNSYITFINNEWGMRTVAYCGYNLPLQSSIKVKEMMKHLKTQYRERHLELLEVLDINDEWRLNSISEGQRKRVQLYLSLIKPFKVCLLDEITVNLDILVKEKFMNYLKKESLVNNSCIVYVTHIFDGLDDWCTGLLYLKKNRDLSIITDFQQIPGIYSYLLEQFKIEHKKYKDIPEEEDIKQELIVGNNAGGYSDGVLVNY